MLKMIQSVLSIILNRPGTFSAKNGIITQRTSPRRNFSTSCWVWFSNATVSNFSISCWLYAFRGLKGYLPFWSRVFPLTVHSQIFFIEGQLDINIARILIFLYSWIFLNLIEESIFKHFLRFWNFSNWHPKHTMVQNSDLTLLSLRSHISEHNRQSMSGPKFSSHCLTVG